MIYSVILVPLLTALSIFLYQNKVKKIIMLGSLILLAMVSLLAILFFYTDYVSSNYVSIFKFTDGLEFSLKFDETGILFILLTAILFPINCFYSIDYMDFNNEKNKVRFYVFLFLSVFAVLLIGFSGSLITIFICYELLTIFTIPLIAHKDDKNSIDGVKIYLNFLIGGSIIFFVPAIIWVWKDYGTLNFVEGGFVNNNPSVFLILFFVLGCAKSATFPMHMWLPAAMVAPTPVSAFLHAVAVVNAGIFVLLRIFTQVLDYKVLLDIVYYDFVVMLISFSIIFSGIIAATQDSLKARLAYSTISQLGFMVMSIVLLPYYGLSPNITIIYMYGHAFPKIVLFFVAGIFYTVAHKTKVSELDGIANKMPLVFILFSLAAFAIMGFPMIGYIFVGKLNLFANPGILPMLILFVGSFLSFLYLFPLLIRMFCFAEDKKELHFSEDIPIRCVYSCITVLILYYIFILFC